MGNAIPKAADAAPAEEAAAARATRKVVIAGLGLIGGSFLKACEKAGHAAKGYHHSETPDFTGAEIVIVAMPPQAIEPWIREHCTAFPEGAVVVDVCGVKRALYDAFKSTGGEIAKLKWHFVGGHPMAGKELGGFANSTKDLFNGASMILTPYPYTGRKPLDMLESFFKSLGFARVVSTSPQHHDEMIAFTSQLCHVISSSYVREPLAAGHAGYSAGSFRDMVRVGAPDPDVWTELFMLNRDNLCEVLTRYIDRLVEFRDALGAADAAAVHAILEDGAEAKKAIMN